MSKIVNLCLLLVIVVLSVLSFNYQKRIHKYQAKMALSPLSKVEGMLYKDDNGFDVLLMGGNDFISKQIYDCGKWEPYIQDAFTKLIKPGDKVLVLGAHIGAHALLISRLVGDRGEVSIFEANPNTLKFLRANIALNNFKNSTIYPFAAFSKNTILNFTASTSGNTGDSHITREGEEKTTNVISVEAVTVDSIKTIKTIDVLQMDIEGAEADAVYGAKELIDNSPNLIVFQEWSPFWLKDPKAYLSFWRSRGYKIAQITDKATLVEINDEQLTNNCPQIDILITKDLAKNIENFKSPI